MGILKILHFDWWQVMLVLVTLMASPLVKALAAVIVVKFVNPEIAKIALPLIFQYKAKKGNTRKIEKYSDNE